MSKLQEAIDFEQRLVDAHPHYTDEDFRKADSAYVKRAFALSMVPSGPLMRQLGWLRLVKPVEELRPCRRRSFQKPHRCPTTLALCRLWKLGTG